MRLVVRKLFQSLHVELKAAISLRAETTAKQEVNTSHCMEWGVGVVSIKYLFLASDADSP